MLIPYLPLTHWGRVTHICVKFKFKIQKYFIASCLTVSSVHNNSQWYNTSSTFDPNWVYNSDIISRKLTIIGSDNGMSLAQHQAIIWTNAGILLIGSLGTKFSEILIEMQTFSLKKTHLKMSGKRRPFCLGLNALSEIWHHIAISLHYHIRQWGWVICKT